MLLYLQRYPDAKVKDTAVALAVQPPTVSTMIHTPIRQGWLTKRRAPSNDRSVCLRLSRQGVALARKIQNQVHRCEADMGSGNLLSMGHRRAKGTMH